jgi:hypothetical protein
MSNEDGGDWTTLSSRTRRWRVSRGGGTCVLVVTAGGRILRIAALAFGAGLPAFGAVLTVAGLFLEADLFLAAR